MLTQPAGRISKTMSEIIFRGALSGSVKLNAC